MDLGRMKHRKKYNVVLLHNIYLYYVESTTITSRMRSRSCYINSKTTDPSGELAISQEPDRVCD